MISLSVSKSGKYILDKDVERLREAGFFNFLIGESVVRYDDDIVVITADTSVPFSYSSKHRGIVLSASMRLMLS